MKKILLLVAGICGLLAGCSHPAHSVAWYEHHQKAMDAMNSHCNDVPDEGINDQNCLNANQAELNHLMQGTTRTFAKPPVFNPNAPSTSDSNGNASN